MFLLGLRRKLTALALCKSIESAIQWFQIHHRITFATIQNPAVYLSGARVSIFSTLVPRLYINIYIYMYMVSLKKTLQMSNLIRLIPLTPKPRFSHVADFNVHNKLLAQTQARQCVS